MLRLRPFRRRIVYRPPLLVATARSSSSSAAAGLTATTWIGTRLVTPLAVTVRNVVAVVTGSLLELYVASPSSLPLVIRTTTVLRQERLAALSAVIAAIAAALASSSA